MTWPEAILEAIEWIVFGALILSGLVGSVVLGCYLQKKMDRTDHWV
jgi:hypothetical protein